MPESGNIINIKLKLTPETDGYDIMRAIGNNLEDVLEITPLKDTGFGHLSAQTEETMVFYDDDPDQSAYRDVPPAFKNPGE